MTAKTTFKCLHCNDLHFADPRNRGRQGYCSAPECRKASKAASQAREENRDYFRGPHHSERVKRWRQANPGYWRRPGNGRKLRYKIPQIRKRLTMRWLRRMCRKWCKMRYKMSAARKSLCWWG